MKWIDISGRKFGRLTVIRFSHRQSSGYLWECKCSCGNRKLIRSSLLKNGNTKSCGCYNNELRLQRNTKHGACGTRQYACWSGMIRRCSNPHDSNYHNYGGRGILVCKKWLTFQGFWEDMAEGYSDHLTIERINVNGNYEKSNCRWATWNDQANNTRRNIPITFRGETRNLKQWALKLGIKPQRLRDRIQKLKWDTEKAFTIPTLDNKTRHIWL